MNMTVVLPTDHHSKEVVNVCVWVCEAIGDLIKNKLGLHDFLYTLHNGCEYYFTFGKFQI